jgi:hypothetical protein
MPISAVINLALLDCGFSFSENGLLKPCLIPEAGHHSIEAKSFWNHGWPLPASSTYRSACAEFGCVRQQASQHIVGRLLNGAPSKPLQRQSPAL